MSLANGICISGAKAQLKKAIEMTKYPLTKEVFRVILVEECGLFAEEAEKLAMFVFDQ